TLFPAMATYLLMVSLNYIRGWADGSDYHVMLQEVRAQFYVATAYLMALNMVEDRRDIGRVFWFSALCIGLKGVLYTYRRYVTMGNGPLPDQGVGSHEEAFFFNCFTGLLLALWLCQHQRRLAGWMWLLLPTTILGFLATNRRAGTAGFIIAIPVIILAAYRGLPERRRFAAIVGLLLATLGPVYYYSFKNSPSQIAQPARALKSHFEPDERDAASNAYRDAENGNIMATIKESFPTTLFGYGYGKPFLKVFQMVNIGNLYDKWDILPHNQILWIWMRTGFVGLLAFFAFISAGLIRCFQILRRPVGDDREYRALAMWTAGVLVMLVVFGLLDLQISNYRNMIFVGLLLGLIEGYRLRTGGDDADTEPTAALAVMPADGK
ncbi:MAG: O-antigen ligase family protein, partial [Armatimonadota bacterium]